MEWKKHNIVKSNHYNAFNLNIAFTSGVVMHLPQETGCWNLVSFLFFFLALSTYSDLWVRDRILRFRNWSNLRIHFVLLFNIAVGSVRVDVSPGTPGGQASAFVQEGVRIDDAFAEVCRWVVHAAAVVLTLLMRYPTTDLPTPCA